MIALNYTKKSIRFIMLLISLAFTSSLIYGETLLFDTVYYFVFKDQIFDLSALYISIFGSMATGIVILASVNGAQEAQTGQRMKSALKMAGAGLLLMAVFAFPFGLAAKYLIY